MSTPEIPDAVRRLADARRDARTERRFAEADRLRDELAAAGWAVEDKGSRYRLTPMHPPDVTNAGRTRYGWSGAVPSRLEEAPVGPASIVFVASGDPDKVEAALASLAGSVADDVQRIVVANAPGEEVASLLARLEGQWAAEGGDDSEDRSLAAATEVVWTAGRFGLAAALNAGIRRASAEVVILLNGGVRAIGDVVTPLAEALSDPAVGVAGPWGLLSGDQRHFAPATGSAAAPGRNVAAIDLGCLAFRRGDHLGRGPLDERFEGDALLGAWWSLVLRDEGEGSPGRRAVIVDVPVVRDAGATGGADEAPSDRRNRYRLIDRFGSRRDLAVGPD